MPETIATEENQIAYCYLSAEKVDLQMVRLAQIAVETMASGAAVEVVGGQ
jgi:hypothetical protein